MLEHLFTDILTVTRKKEEMNSIVYFRLFVGARVVGRAYNANDAYKFYKNNLASAVYKVYSDGTSVLWLMR